MSIDRFDANKDGISARFALFFTSKSADFLSSRPLGKGEVECSIHSGSTIKSQQNQRFPAFHRGRSFGQLIGGV
jgi:hypothetical protein